MITTLILSAAFASSHREAPMIAMDPAADITDFYVFLDPNNSDRVVFLMNVLPLQASYSGPNFHNFDDNVLYEIHVDNEGDAQEDITFQFQTETTFNIPDTFLYNDGVAFGAPNGGVQGVDGMEDVNIGQTWTLTRVDDGTATTIATGDVPPANVGARSMVPGGYDPTSDAGGSITTSHVVAATSGGVGYDVFAGPRQEMFYVDLGRTFDLLGVVEGFTDGLNANSLLGFNVHTIAVSVDKKSLTKDGVEPTADGKNDVIAAWATTSRRAVTIRRGGGEDVKSRGEWVQVSRLGMPLVNEAVLPISQKDKFSASHPSGDIDFASWVVEPILPIYMEAVLETKDADELEVAADAALDLTAIGLEEFLVGREDIAATFLFGYTGFCTMPGDYAFGGAIPGESSKTFSAFEAVRINLNGCAAWGGADISFFPDGRGLMDDVVDIELSALAGYVIGESEFLGDGVDSTGLTALSEFPFMGDPWPGANY